MLYVVNFIAHFANICRFFFNLFKKYLCWINITNDFPKSVLRRGSFTLLTLVFQILLQSKLSFANLFSHKFWHIGFEDICDCIAFLYNFVVHLLSFTVSLPNLNHTPWRVQLESDIFFHMRGIAWYKARYFKQALPPFSNLPFISSIDINSPSWLYRSETKIISLFIHSLKYNVLPPVVIHSLLQITWFSQFCTWSVFCETLVENQTLSKFL